MSISKIINKYALEKLVYLNHNSHISPELSCTSTSRGIHITKVPDRLYKRLDIKNRVHSSKLKDNQESPD